MNHTFAFDETTIKRMPHFLIFIILLLLGLPYFGLNLGLNFGIKFNEINDKQLNIYLLESQVRGYFRQILLQWSGLALAAVTTLLAFTRYKLSKDKIAFVIGVSIGLSGLIEVSHTLLIDELSLSFNQKNNYDALIWTFSNSIGGLTFIIGLTYLLHTSKEKKLNPLGLFFLCSSIALVGLISIHALFITAQTPAMWFKGRFTSRPYEIISITIYLILIIRIYPKVYKKYPSILSHSIYYIGVTQVIMGMYLMILSHEAYDSAFNIAYFLKIVNYFIPCVCLIIYYVYSYAAVIKAQKELAHKQEELKYIATHDSLTNLFNRREFEELLNKSVSNASRAKTSLALLLIDLDNFKATNDTFGHMHGDELLKQFSNRLVLLIRKGDILARIGGDEFTLITSNIASPSAARQQAQRILNELNSPYLINGKLITVTVSIGISIFPTDGQDAEKLLIKADLAMYKAKNSGKNTYQFYTEELSHLQHRESEIEAHLRKALQEDQFELKFQPKYNLVNKKIIGAEILLRWNNKSLNYPSPNEFIPVAEHSGLIMDIGNWVLKKTCEQIVTWKQKYPDANLSYSINISPIQLANNHFLSIIKKIFQDLNYSANDLEFEITENVLMCESNEVTEVLNSIADLGIKISLDDFGKGYSSLNRLKMLPIDTLKIDKIFISDIHNERDKVVIVDIIIKLAYELGMDIIAEGVETAEQLEYLVSKKCYSGQGFLLSQPLSTADFEKIALGG